MCNLLAVAAVAFNISPAVIYILLCVNSSTVPLALIAFVLYKLKVAGVSAVSVMVKVTVSALPESSDTKIESTTAVLLAGHV